MNRCEAIIFDWGNTLVDYPLRTETEQLGFLRAFLFDHAALLRDTAGIDVEAAIDDREALAAFNRENDDFAVRAFAERLGTLLRSEIAADRAATLAHELCRRIFATASVIAGAPDLLAAARRAGLRACILSNTPWGTSVAHWKNEVARHEFAAACAAVVFCGDVGYRKPHRAVFERCARLLGTAPQATVMVGDSLTSDVIGAENCGHRAIWFDRDRAPNPERRQSVERLDQLRGMLGF